jgi:putative PIN family toxin of toxin-antitoxin system
VIAVLDTNILVSALWTDKGNPRKILDMVGRKEIKPCYDFRILAEYEDVLRRPKFKFSSRDVDAVLARIRGSGLSVAARESAVNFPDETDRIFYEVAETSGAFLVTGNLKHYPAEPFIMSPAGFILMCER